MEIVLTYCSVFRTVGPFGVAPFEKMSETLILAVEAFLQPFVHTFLLPQFFFLILDRTREIEKKKVLALFYNL